MLWTQIQLEVVPKFVAMACHLLVSTVNNRSQHPCTYLSYEEAVKITHVPAGLDLQEQPNQNILHAEC